VALNSSISTLRDPDASKGSPSGLFVEVVLFHTVQLLGSLFAHLDDLQEVLQRLVMDPNEELPDLLQGPLVSV
jgi:hypothetical protein